MERVIRVTGTYDSFDALALAVEGAVDEVDSLRKRRGYMTHKPDNPEGGDAYYNQNTDTVEIYNSVEGTWKVQ